MRGWRSVAVAGRQAGRAARSWHPRSGELWAAGVPLQTGQLQTMPSIVGRTWCPARRWVSTAVGRVWAGQNGWRVQGRTVSEEVDRGSHRGGCGSRRGSRRGTGAREGERELASRTFLKRLLGGWRRSVWTNRGDSLTLDVLALDVVILQSKSVVLNVEDDDAQDSGDAEAREKHFDSCSGVVDDFWIFFRSRSERGRRREMLRVGGGIWSMPRSHNTWRCFPCPQL